jgi:hypothetical protein
MSGCRILDDKDLEEQAVKLNRADMRLWLPDTLGETRIFDRGFIKPFPKAFQAKTYNEEYPSLSISTIQTARPVYKNTISLLERVRGILSTPIETTGEKAADPVELYEPRTPPYGECIKTSE